MSVSQSLAEAIRSPAARIAAARGGSADRPFKPKFCRTRSCNQLFGHELGCVGVSTKRTVSEVVSKPRPQYGGRPTPRSTVTRSAHALPITGVREHMAVIRAHHASQQGHKSAKQRRQERALIRAVHQPIGA